MACNRPRLLGWIIKVLRGFSLHPQRFFFLYPKNNIIDPNNFLPVSVVGIIKVNLLWLIFIAVLHPQFLTSVFFFLLPPFSLFCVVWSGPNFPSLSFESAISGASGPCFSEVVTVVLLSLAAQGHPHVIRFKKKWNRFQNPFGIF